MVANPAIRTRVLASAVISSRARRPTPSANPAWPDAVIENSPIRNAGPPRCCTFSSSEYVYDSGTKTSSTT